MNSFIPLGALKRDEIYSFIGGFFIAGSWYIFLKTSPDSTTISSIDVVTDVGFLLLWLLSTAFLFTVQLILSIVVARLLRWWLKGKTQAEKKKILNFQDQGEFFMFGGIIDEIKTSIHLVGILIAVIPLSVFPVYRLLMLFVSCSVICIITALVVITYMCLLFFYIKFWKWFMVIDSLRGEGTLEIIDQSTYAKERAIFFAQFKNEQSKKNVQ